MMFVCKDDEREAALEDGTAHPNLGPRDRDGAYDDIYTADAVMARVGHLDRDRRHHVEQITRLIRSSFAGMDTRPKPEIRRIMLLGPYAKRGWRVDDADAGLPSFNLWVIVDDPLFTDARLWRIIAASIVRDMGDRCRLSLSCTASKDVKAGRRSGDVAMLDRWRTGITLYRAKRDGPRARRGKGVSAWYEARSRFDAAAAAFEPASLAMRDAERAYFATHPSRGDRGSVEDPELLRLRVVLGQARIEDERLGTVRYEALMTLLHTPAPDLSAVIVKLDLICREGDGDDHALRSVLADARWLAARAATHGRRR